MAKLILFYCNDFIRNCDKDVTPSTKTNRFIDFDPIHNQASNTSQKLEKPHTTKSTCRKHVFVFFFIARFREKTV